MLGGTDSGLAPEVEVWQGLLVETILTFFLVNTIYNAAVSGKVKLAAGAAIGLTLTVSIFLGGPLTGASLNPAQTIGPDVVTGISATSGFISLGLLSVASWLPCCISTC